MGLPLLTETTPREVDLHVSARLRILRKLRGLSQQALAQHLETNVQHLRKLESGAARLSSAALWRAARCLGVEVADFYDGLSSPCDVEASAVGAFLASDEGLLLVENISKLRPARRKAVLALIRAISNTNRHTLIKGRAAQTDV